MTTNVRKAISGSVVIAIVVMASFAMVGTLAMAQGGTASTSSTTATPSALTGLPAWYACTYGNWGCPQPASPEAVDVSEGMPAFYACKYGNWQCPSLPTLAADQVSDSLPAFYACTYGNWGCQ